MLPMKLLVCALILLAGQAQSAATQTLLKTDTSFPAAGGPGLKWALLNDQTATLLGGKGSLLLGENIGIGAAGYSLSSQLTTDVNGIIRDITFSYFGLSVDNFFLPRKLIFLNLSTLVAYGNAAGSRRDLFGTKDNTSFFLVEPEFNLMLNVTKELRLAFGVSYRLIAGSDTSSVLGTNLSGFAGSLTMMYGK
jgi:hypothetical protein